MKLLLLVCWLLFSSTFVSQAGTQTLSLGGQWQVSAAGQPGEFDVQVPGDVYQTLIFSGRIPPPSRRDNEARVQWVAQTAWLFRRTFDVPPELLAREVIRLRCEGLDTLATLRLNGIDLGAADNQFRTWEFDVKKALRPGANTLEIAFGSVPAYLARRQSEPSPLAINSLPPPFTNGSAFIRKAPYSFGWDFGPEIRTVGIWKPISLVAFDGHRLNDVAIRQTHGQPGEPVHLGVDVTTEAAGDGSGGPLSVEVRVEYGATPVMSAIRSSPEHPGDHRTATVTADHRAHVDLTITDPQLWWPNGLGAHPLYRVTATLRDAAGHELDHEYRRIGLRQVQVFPKKDGEPFALAVNGVRFFAKGANFVPIDYLPARWRDGDVYRRLISDAARAHMNVLRCWGGGYYEDDAFFDACDEEGILVWEDFKFACAVYPAFDPAFLENVRAEVRDQVRRLRHHASLGLWCGNNEVAQLIGTSTGLYGISPTDYDKLFRQAIPDTLHALDPDAPYISGSPGEGDEHYWAVWHGMSVFADYNKQHGFFSEFGMQSFPEPSTVAQYTDEADRKSIDTPVMRWHQKSGKGNDKILTFIDHYYRPPKDFDSTLWLSQIMQADGIRQGVEGWRRDWPRSTGSLYWQYNDEWPGPTWSSIDSTGKRKALYYAAGRFYAPVLVSGVARADTGEVDVFLVNDRRQETGGTLRWCATDLAGAKLDGGESSWRCPAQTSNKLQTLALQPVLDAHGGPKNVLVWLEAVDGNGETLSHNLVTFVPPKEMNLVPPQIHVEVTADPTPYRDKFTVTLSSAQPALWTWITSREATLRCSDNFVHLQPGVKQVLQVDSSAEIDLEKFKAALEVHSLTDTYAASTVQPGLPAPNK